MAEFKMDLTYFRGEWSASCAWADGELGVPHNRRLHLKAAGTSPDNAVSNLVALVDHLLGETSKRIRSDFSKMDI